jgi:hypothetical protein
MIPFEEEASLTASEEYAQELLESNWENVVRTTPGVKEDLEQKFPQVSETVSRKIREDTGVEFSDIFRPGVPDFLAFDDRGNYKFVEVKSGKDGLRHSQLKWLRDFSGISAEIWFAREREIEERLDSENIQAYTFQDRKGENSKNKVVGERGSKFLLELPKTFASILGIEKENSVDWRLKSKDELILDSR